MAFNLEDKICWEELAPSLQDKFKALINLIQNGDNFMKDRIGDVRLTIGPEPPPNPIEYAELWFDTNIMAMRAYAHEQWSITRASWFVNSASSVVSTVEANLSSNPRTNCHCYTIKWPDPVYCHCKTQLWDSSTVAIGTSSNLAFNTKIDNAQPSRRYRFILSTSQPGVQLASLNLQVEGVSGDAIVDHENGQTVMNSQGEYQLFCEFDSKYDALFDYSSYSTYTVNPGTTYIALDFANPVTVTSIHASLFGYSNGPVTITLQEDLGTGYFNLYSITLAGNAPAYSRCHSHCHHGWSW